VHVSRFDPLDIGEVARRLGISAAALRLYEKRGLLNATRTASGYRQYSCEDLHRARLVRRARRAGLTLAQIEVLMKRADRAGLHRLLRTHLERLEREGKRIERLRRHLRRWMKDAPR
jgi:DNA-binding transcriptional MerR regulator